jgi:hypothetical protein
MPTFQGIALAPIGDAAPARQHVRMDTPETEERGRLATVQARHKHALQDIESRLNHYAKDIPDQKTYLWESKADMDHAEKNSTRENSPYFTRFNFSRIPN